MACFTLTNDHITLLRRLRTDGSQDVFNNKLPPILAEMAAAKLVKWDTTATAELACGQLKLGHVSMLPDGLSTLEDFDELCPEIIRLA